MTSPRPFQTLAPPPTQGLAVAYLTPLLAPTPVATRRPQPSNTSDTIHAFLRVEAGGGGATGNEMFFDTNVLLHAYAPNSQESQAEQLAAEANAWAANAQGTSITHPSTGQRYFVAFSEVTQLPTKVQDPLVNLVCFFSMCTWRIQGRPL